MELSSSKVLLTIFRSIISRFIVSIHYILFLDQELYSWISMQLLKPLDFTLILALFFLKLDFYGFAE
jgi:hypothetical protein